MTPRAKRLKIFKELFGPDMAVPVPKDINVNEQIVFTNALLCEILMELRRIRKKLSS